MVSFDSKKYSKKLLHLISWSHWFTFFNIIAAIALSSFYLFSEAKPDTLLGQVYLITTWVSHIAFLTFMSFVLLLFPLTIVFPNTKFIRTSGSLIFAFGLLLLVLDGFIYSRLGYHLNASSSTQIILLITEQIKDESRLFWLISITFIVAVLAFEFIVSNYAWKHLKQLQKTIFTRYVIFGFVLSFFFSHLVHIWADANLEYDILRQDTVLPISYPTTAKALLTKYGLFNQVDYIERKNSPLSFSQAIPNYPIIANNQCKMINKQQSVFLILTDEVLQAKTLQQFNQRTLINGVKLSHHIDTGINNESWFNLFYALPSIYEGDILAQQVPPLLFQSIRNNNLASTFTEVSQVQTSKNSLITNHQNLWFEALFDKKQTLTDISSLIFNDSLNNLPAGLHLIYFKGENLYQFELFVDALLLAQKQKEQSDILFISSIGNKNKDSLLSIKPSILLWPNTKSHSVKQLTSHMDLPYTLLKRWLGCQLTPAQNSNGSDLLVLDKYRVIANANKTGIMVFNKDKSVSIDQNGNFQSYSRQLDAPITVTPDFPLMIDGVQYIKRFSEQK